MKSLLSFVILFLLACFSYSQTLNDGLLIYYPFSGNANDHSGNGFDGVGNASLTTDQYGTPNSAYSFNGVDQYIDLPLDDALKPDLPLSFSFMVSFHSFEPEDAVIFTTDYNEYTHSGAWMNISSSGKLSISYGDAYGNFSIDNRRTKNGSIVSPANTWHHVIGIIRGPYDMDVYIDCNYDSGTYEGNGYGLGYTDGPGSLGRKDANFAIPPFYFKGKIDKFRYWNRALTQKNIDSLCALMVEVENYELRSNKVSVYPNPFDNEISIDSNEDISQVLIIDALGNLLGRHKFTSNLNLSYLMPGLYFLKFYDNNHNLIQTRKVFKK